MAPLDLPTRTTGPVTLTASVSDLAPAPFITLHPPTLPRAPPPSRYLPAVLAATPWAVPWHLQYSVILYSFILELQGTIVHDLIMPLPLPSLPPATAARAYAEANGQAQVRSDGRQRANL